MKELIIVGAGPAGLACSIYASRFKIDHLIIAKSLGGTVAEAHLIQNYPGLKEIAGQDLAERMVAHAQSYGVEIVQEEITKIQSSQASSFKLQASNGQNYQAKTLFLGLGTKIRHLEVPGEKEFLGRGVAYCASCDAPLYKNKVVAVIGGGNSAVTAALHLAEFCPQVYLINRSETLRAEPFWQDQSKEQENIKIILNTNVTKIIGDEVVTGVKLDNPHEGKDALTAQGVFIEIGATPSTALAKDLGAELTKNGLIKIQPDGLTTVPGVWAGGDAATAEEDLEPRQVVHAVSEGAVAALSIFKHLRGTETKV